jgi:hypothetical protein
MNSAESNDLAKSAENLKYIQWTVLYDNLYNVGLT